MNTRFLLALAVTALATAAFSVSANDAALSPRAKDNQVKLVAGTTAAQPAPASAVAVSPRAQASQIKTVAGTSNEINPYLTCRQAMTGSSPKAIGACVGTPGMPGCVAIAAMK